MNHHRHDVLPYLDALREHLVRHDVPSPVSVECTNWREPIAVHLYEITLSDLASALLLWTKSLDGVTVTAKRMRHDQSVHLTVVGRVASGVPLHVWGGVRFERPLFPDLPTGVEQDVELSTLHRWKHPGQGVAA
ncbi:hypothetical protein LWP59_38990 [Amycolatopsis acidiphila]|uniref:Uncharacterized protein n=1 Tax=Amycolatopsis acidiphila TaxID=715473 RepID=A0A558AGN7_9PSEU|nr:hypothetical protein [Amycolatopsis acidiphila]TVT23445.1 hypothetical protein FNH06_09620 [Amycolatopsis acidiphila]UIJ59900.1 hypothetical protein LWP59_38990 [Amycolatopsis acidiphila]GHG62550.1 hypothetical protein GCM10017788_18200 [Amycolatopsis acidiphila]